MKLRTLTFAALAAAGLITTQAQTPMPIIVPAATPARPVSTVPAKPAAATNSADLSVLGLLEEMKAQNAETLRKQTALLEALDELQQAADQLRIYASRT